MYNALWMSPAGALWQGQAGGKLAVLGSVAVFDDKWLDIEDNAQIMDWLFRWLKPVHSCCSKVGLARTASLLYPIIKH